MNRIQLFSLAVGSLVFAACCRRFEALPALIVALVVVGFVPYIWEVVTRRTKPVRGTWLVYAALDVSVTLNMWLAGTLNALMVAGLIGSTIVFVLTLFLGDPGWELEEKLCLVGAVVALVLAAVCPALGEKFGLLVMVLGSVPMFVKTWRDPSREDRFAWNAWTTSCVLAVLAVPAWTVAHLAQPVTFMAIQGTMFVIVNFRRPTKLAAA